ncbi:hypothetical protein B9Z55_022143 [Caenorhabditis nigoni]|uniref:RING-type domain-containing protein n=1 Tax=Caenorhabditis nigoni TaxID=1611254 RepID=A0A2G5TV49_9PELO|nr:hypothetical protein B9Z55_022143 [Caenorhabditis nigoni]
MDGTPEARARDQFYRRQNRSNRRPTRISLDLKYVEEWPCRLQDVSISQRDGRTKKPDEIRQVCEVDRERIINAEWFGRILDEVRQQIRSLETDDWINSAVFYRLGPKTIIEAQEGYLLGRNYRLLVNPNNALAYLLLQSFGSEDDDIAAIENFLNLRNINYNSELLSIPNTEFMMLYKYGEKPKLVNSPKNSTIALVYDFKYLRETSQSSREDQTLTPEQFYQYHLNCPLRSTRLLSDSEKKWLQKNDERYNFPKGPLRVLQFYTVEDRTEAVKQDQFEFLDALFCESMLNYRNVMEQVNLFVTYSEQKHDDMVEVTLFKECYKVIAEDAFLAHNLKCSYFDGKHEDEESRYDINHKTIVLSGFPKHLSTFEGKFWFVERIVSKNNIGITSIKRFPEHNSNAQETFSRARNNNLPSCIEQELDRIGHNHRIFHSRPNEWTWEWLKEREGDPLNSFQNDSGRNHGLETFNVRFRTIPIGLRFIEQILKEASDGPIFQADHSDEIGPKIVPCFRLSITISRAMRYALREAIMTLDREMRQTFRHLLITEDVRMLDSEASYYGVRLCEDWGNESETGVLEVEGWNPVSVRFFMGKLLETMVPLELESTPNETAQLFYGVGESYVRNLPKKYEEWAKKERNGSTKKEESVIVDIDHFSQKIRLWGGAAEKALEDLMNYSRNKSNIIIEATIPLHFPYFNDSLREFLSFRVINNIKKSLDLKKLDVDSAACGLSFEGTIEAYEKLIEGLTELSAAVFYKGIEGNRALEDIQNEYMCIACLEKGFARTNDFYRLHCGHSFCRACLRSCISSKINSGELKIKCPWQSCEMFISPTNLMDIVLGDDRRVKDVDAEKLRILVQKTRDAIVEADRGREVKTCSTADCIGIYSKEKGDVRDLKECITCGKPYCRWCLSGSHENQSCVDAKRIQNSERSLEAFIRESGGRVKPCPTRDCGSIIEKSDGCNHMICPKCEIHFCWICLFTAEEQGPIYAHMQEVHNSFYEDNHDEDQPAQGQYMYRYQPAPPGQHWYMGVLMSDTETSDNDSDDEIDELNRRRLNLPENAPINEIRRRAAEMQRNGAFQRRRTPTPPRRPRRFERLPPVVLNNLPDITESDDEAYLGFLNTAATIEEQEERIRDLSEV